MASPRPNRTFDQNAKKDNTSPDDGTQSIRRTYAINPAHLDRDFLRGQTHWIRDVLDPQVAREGPDVLHSDDLLTIDELLRALLELGVTRDDLLYSRIHLAVGAVAGLATRWPRKLVEKCDALKDNWASTFGDLQGTVLYEQGGRLHGICTASDLDKERLIVKWLKSPGARLSPSVARKVGHLGFEPGDWWISALFAHRDGIIDSASSEGRIVADDDAAYAIVMAGSDEVFSPDGQNIQYRARSSDSGRYRLTAASPESRHPIRVLRSHRLNSAWRPRAGLRYEGLYQIVGWSLKFDKKSNETVYTVNLKRLAGQVDFETVLARPWSDELEDYKEYKRLHDLEHAKLKTRQTEKQDSATIQNTLDGTSDGPAAEIHWSPRKRLAFEHILSQTDSDRPVCRPGTTAQLEIGLAEKSGGNATSHQGTRGHSTELRGFDVVGRLV
ncbi:hypothetical protein CERZMDRAFT_81401 [Cercospora zeae-maydis SCOH1-5]|uniref:YDG domain-containing protein n=1 Tax=Cercospora zeae-maydis SCOH1-5 TaxID=717836 RepID=A0A6A6FS63_9PEZI|nr:hypothetical protein CERZMDRAFT_81401 [Cercospora zeae-maydis SCOH1-5]